MTDRPTPNPPAWVHTRLSNLEAAVGDLTVRLADIPGTADALHDTEWRQQRAWLSRQADTLTDILVRLDKLEGAATPVCAPVVAATSVDGLREPGEAETALKAALDETTLALRALDTRRCDRCNRWDQYPTVSRFGCCAHLRGFTVAEDFYCAAFEAKR